MILTMGGDVTSKGAQEMMKALAEINKEFTRLGLCLQILAK